VIDDTTLEMTPTERIVTLSTFWPDDCKLPEGMKERRFWEYNRATRCNTLVGSLALVLKKLCDAGVELHFDNDRVENIWILNTVTFDVADLLPTCLKLHDPVSGATVPIIGTHEGYDKLSALGKDVCRRLGWNVPRGEDDECRRNLKAHHPESYATTVPHWWLVAIVGSERRMIHLDLCGPTYCSDAKAFHHGVPLKIFETPEYTIERPPLGAPDPDKFLLLPYLATAVKEDRLASVMQPKSLRHLRAFLSSNYGFDHGIGVRSLEDFLSRQLVGFMKSCPEFRGLTEGLYPGLFLETIVPGVEVVVCNVKSKPELNGRKGQVHSAPSNGRVAVCVAGLSKPIRLKPSCISLKKANSAQYSSLESAIENAAPAAPARTLTESQRAAVVNALENDSDFQKVFQRVQTGNLPFSMYADPDCITGMQKLLNSPLGKKVLPPESAAGYAEVLALAQHPKAQNAIQIMMLIREAKQQAMQEVGITSLGGGMTDEQKLNWMHAIHAKSSVKRAVAQVKAEVGLHYVFDRLEELNLYPAHPVKVWS
jgi:hypothetical protein